MNVIYAQESFPESFSQSLFLAGPTPREPGVPSWRPEALKLLEEAGYEGVVFVPEPRDGQWAGNYDGQVNWESTALEMADVILFWVPREMTHMPGFCTNEEWGMWKTSGKAVFGAPPEAVHVKYQRHWADRLNIPNCLTLADTVGAALVKMAKPAIRTGGERWIPLDIWHQTSFQDWYGNVKLARNRLDGAKIVWTFRLPNGSVFFWSLLADIYVTSEDRHKTNEVVTSRPSMAAVVAYRGRGESADVLLVREFRTPVSNVLGYVWELPGGSSVKPNRDPRETAAEEIEEETGLAIDFGRLVYRGGRQVAATVSAHHVHLLSVELTEEEMKIVRQSSGRTFGVEADTERTTVEVWTAKAVMESPLVDWSVKGMVAAVVS